MTKKDYIKIANILKTTELEPHKRASLAVSFAAVCREDNPNFDFDRFLAACGDLWQPTHEARVDDYDRDLENKVEG
jgi:hypothetical protein